MSSTVESATEIRPFQVEIPGEALDDLRRRIAETRWPTKELAQDRRLKTKLQVTGDLFERVPDVILVFEQLRVSRVFEIEKVGGRKHE